ncbi:hypothetical protein ACTG4T_14660 [Enterococcus faecium]|uniref:hypothetical protein n=1 Tax=Enterococcus faecium TaxID=1352 RepID=UPI003F79C703
MKYCGSQMKDIGRTKYEETLPSGYVGFVLIYYQDTYCCKKVAKKELSSLKKRLFLNLLIFISLFHSLVAETIRMKFGQKFLPIGKRTIETNTWVGYSRDNITD